ncbi:MAG: PorT family protein [Chitinophagaceae bacterium]|nr:PorT family protein [Chitinophagaceae bacterium]
MVLKSIFSVALLLTGMPIFAQQKKFEQFDSERFFRFGAKGGVNVNKITGQSYKAGFNYNYQVGGFLQFNFSNRFGLQPEVNFVQSSSEFSNDATVIYDDLFRGGGQKNAKLNYLEIPLLLNVNVGVSKHVKLQFGPAYGAMLKQTVDSLQTAGNIYKNSDWSAIGGLWIQLPLINLGARYKYGLTNINAVDDRQTWRNQSIQIFLGITF